MAEIRQVYMDYSATTPVKKEVLDEMIPYFTEFYGNASSLYSRGEEAKNAIENARGQVAALIGAMPKEVFFTSGGTEADNWAIFSTARRGMKRGKGNHIITSKIEHHAVLHTCAQLEKEGFEVTYLDIDSDGRVRPEDVEAAIKDTTVLITIMLVNNEMGAVQPVKEIGAIAKAHDIVFHCDGVQALGNVEIDVKEMGIDLLSMSSHKIYGPKGVGALYVRKGVNLPVYMFGGAQENKKRAGTENIPAIVGFGKAAEIAKTNFDDHVAHLTELRDYLTKRITEEVEDTHANGGFEFRHPGNTNITFKYVEGESLLMYLDMKGVQISTGSACSSKSLEPSHVLTALGVPVEDIHGSLRFTVGDPTTKEDIDYVVEQVKVVVERLREISSVSREKGW